MTVPDATRPPEPLASARVDVERVLGPAVAARVRATRDGHLYVSTGQRTLVLAWLVDLAVFLVLVLAGLVALVLGDRSVDLAGGLWTLTVIGVVVLVPVLYGLLCYRDGRALGGAATGTRLVRAEDGGRIGAAAPWAMVIRTLLLPLLFAAMLLVVLLPDYELARISVDDAGTRLLHDANFRRLP